MVLLLPLVITCLPALAAVVALLMKSEARRPQLLPVTAGLHLVLTITLLAGHPPSPGVTRLWIGVDALGGLTLLVISVLFLLVALYTPGYLALRSNRPNRLFTASLLAFLSMASLVSVSQQIGLLWVSLEATTLTTAPLVYFNRNARSLEATWKYLVIGSVGIALALLGTFAIAYGGMVGGLQPPLIFDQLVTHGALLSRPWVRAGFVLMLVGYGTKMGLAPLHSWKPDAYGEAPGLVGAILAGGVTSCAFLAVLRSYTIAAAAGEGGFARTLLVAFGLVSLVAAAAFLSRQRDLKRMLAYSSVEHMGILALGVGAGGAATEPALLHLVNNAMTKALLFLAVANIHRAYGSRSVPEVSGVLRRLPWSGWLFFAGLFAITGAPPFGMFVSEFGVLRGTLGGGHNVAAFVFLAAIGAIAIGMSATVINAVQGKPAEHEGAAVAPESFAMTAPLVLAGLIILVLGLWIPGPLTELIGRAGQQLREHA